MMGVWHLHRNEAEGGLLLAPTFPLIIKLQPGTSLVVQWQGILWLPSGQDSTLFLLGDGMIPGREIRSYKPCGQKTITSVMSDSVRPHRPQPARLHHPWESPGIPSREPGVSGDFWA